MTNPIMTQPADSAETCLPVHSSQVQQSVHKPSWKTLIKLIGLPCLISVAAIDPGNLEVDLQAGQLVQYRLIWSLMLSSVIGFVLQTLSAHVTILTGRHLAEICASAYPNNPIVSISIFVFAELSVVAFDVAEVVGTAFALQILFSWPLWLGMLMSAFDTMLVLYLQKHGLTKLELVIEGMLFVLAFCLFYEFVITDPKWMPMLQGLVVPTFGTAPREGAILAIGILGSIIMSHNLYLHSWLMKQRIQETPPPTRNLAGECRYATLESAAIFIATFLINACVMSVTAALPESSMTKEIGLKDAGALLQNVLGTRFANFAWGMALLASGHAATVTGTLASQAVCEGFLNVREGNSAQWMVLMTRAVAIIPALIAALIAGEDGADRLIVLSQVVLSFALPFAIIPVFKVLLQVGGREWLMKSGYIGFGVLIVANCVAAIEGCRQVAQQGVIGLQIVIATCLATVALLWKLIATPLQLEDREERQKLVSERGVMYQ